MADISQVLAAGGTTIVGVAVGAGLTYLFGALNRRHQEAREDETRWYEARLQAYTNYYRVYFDALYSADDDTLTQDERLAVGRQLIGCVGPVVLTASEEASEAAVELARETATRVGMGSEYNSKRLTELNEVFYRAARKDLGQPLTTKPSAK
jgi:hypothetical protein